MTNPDWPERWLLPEKYQSKAAKAIARSKAKRASREGNNAEHLIHVRQLWCTLGSRDARPREAIHAHHLQGGPCRKLRSLGKRSPDIWTVPLVWWRHEELHALGSRHEYEYFMDNSKGRINPYALAVALSSADSLNTKMSILYAHQTQDTRGLLLLSLEEATLQQEKG